MNPIPHKHDKEKCGVCMGMWMDGLHSCPPLTIERCHHYEFIKIVITILLTWTFTYWTMKRCPKIIHDGGYPVATHDVVTNNDPPTTIFHYSTLPIPTISDWEKKCRRAWKILKEDPRAGREAFRVLDQ